MSKVRMIVFSILLIMGVVIWFMIFELVFVLYIIGNSFMIIVVVVIIIGCICKLVLCNMAWCRVFRWGFMFFCLYFFSICW